MAARRRAAAPAPVEELEEIDELEEVGDDDGLEELEEAPEPEPVKPAKRTRAAAKAAPAPAKTAKATKAAAAPAETSEYDSNWLASHVSEETGIDHDGRSVRMLLRKLAKEGAFAREIGEDRSRYTFPKGANDPVVKKIIVMVKSGEAKAVRNEGLETVKANAAAKKAAPAKTAPAKAAPAKATSTRTARTRRAAVAE